LQGAEQVSAPDGETGAGLALQTTRGTIHTLLHAADGDGETAVLFAPGARGGFGGPAERLYAELAGSLAAQGVTCLRIDYRHAANLDESTLDVLVAVWHLNSIGRPRTAVVGHSFGGGVVIQASRYSTNIRGVAALSSQTMGARDVVLLAPRPLLVVHGEADNVLPVANSKQIYDWAFDPKELVTYPGAKHGLREVRPELRALLMGWLPSAAAS
jgi:alpha/beta superfamily hydrolase